MPLLQEAVAWYMAGYMPLPVKPDGSKAPAVTSWTQYQKERPSLPEVLELFEADTDGIGLICGAVSGGLEMLELEGRAVAEGYIDRVRQAFIDHDAGRLWNRLVMGYVEETPSGGVHYYYRVDGHSLRNRKLARRPATPDELTINPDEKLKVLIETRGEGGFSVIAPSAGRTHETRKAWEALNNPSELLTISGDERDAIHAICSTLDQVPVQEMPAPTSRGPLQAVPDELRPGDDFNNRATWKEILEPHGWTVRKHYGGNLYGWAKPGKTHPGISATTGRNEADRLYVFSTSTPFDTETPYSKFGALALLEHGGDFAAAARALRLAGYGGQSEQRDGTRSLARGTVPSTAELIGGEPPKGPALNGEAESTLDAFWDARPVLAHIREFALSRMMPPWAVLGNCILRVLATIPPYVVLPPIIGGYGSLNLFAALVAPSGMGKGGSDRAAKDAIHFLTDDLLGIYTAPVGSGEGIAHQYAHRTKNGIERDRDAVLFEVPEVDTLTALGGRQGSTLLSQLRLAFSGERLGFGYADAIKRIPIEADSYRLCLSVGVQPERAGPILWDADGGTPQRFIWLPAKDTDITVANRPETPPPLVIEKQEFERNGLYSKFHVLPIPEPVVQFILEHQEKRHAGDSDALDAHSIFAREKVAQALTFLDQRQEMTLEDWELSGVIMMMSKLTRDRVEISLAAKQTKIAEIRAKRQASTETIIETAKVEQALARVSTIICRHARSDSNGGVAWNDVKKSLASRDREWFEEAVERLVTDGLVQLLDSSRGRHIRLIGGKS